MCESAPLRCGGPRPRSGPSGGVYCVSAVSRRDARGSRDAVVSRSVLIISFHRSGPATAYARCRSRREQIYRLSPVTHLPRPPPPFFARWGDPRGARLCTHDAHQKLSKNTLSTRSHLRGRIFTSNFQVGAILPRPKSFSHVLRARVLSALPFQEHFRIKPYSRRACRVVRSARPQCRACGGGEPA